MATIFEMFKNIKINDDSGILESSAVLDAYARKASREIGFTLKTNRQVSDDLMEKLKREIAENYNAVAVNIKIDYIENNEIDFKQIVDYCQSSNPISFAFLQDANFNLSADKLTVELHHGGENLLTANGVNRLIEHFVKETFGNNVTCKFIEIKDTREKKTQIPKAVQKPVKKSDSSEVILGKPIAKKPISINQVAEDSGKVVVMGQVFAVDERITKDNQKVILSFGITDNTSSIKVKIFPLLTKEQGKVVKEKIEKAGYVKVFGEVTYDKYDRDININPVSIVSEVASKRVDDSEEKRIELHLHTTMSAMDAVTSVEKYIDRAKEWNLEAIAITDHGVVQAFPPAFRHAEKIKYEGKIIYGVEAYFVNDTSPILFGNTSADFMSDIVVFDLETTGFSPITETIIEIGAVKISNGKIVDKFSTFVFPDKPIPAKITELTGITDLMVEDAPSAESAMKDFIEFAGDGLLVAHNANFDMSFVKACTQKYGIEYSPAYLDTLALSRKMYRNFKNYKLNTLAQELKAGDFNHHRACDDAAVLANILLIMLNTISKEHLINTFADFNKNINSIFEGFDYSKVFPKHQIILAKNRAGLRNLFILISQSHLKYYHKKPRIPKSLLMQYREGLIIGSACEAGELYSAILENRSDSEIEDIASFYDYLEIQPLSNNLFLIDAGRVANVNALKAINKRIYELGKKLNKPVVATCDAHFLDPDDEQYRKVLLVAQEYKDGDKPMPLYFRTTKEMIDEFSYLGEEAAKEVVIKNPKIIADMCERFSPLPPDILFKPKIEGSDDELRNTSYERAKELYGDPIPEWIKTRLDKELSNIIEHGYSVTYVIAGRLVKESTANGYLVGSRGSVGSSIAAYMFGITEVNGLPPHYLCPNCKHSELVGNEQFECGVDMPDKNCPVCGTKYKKEGFDIPFETFLGFNADKVPDIDLNFSGEYQSQMHKYVEKLLGKDNIFRAGTISGLQEKNAIGYVRKYAELSNLQLSNIEIVRLGKGCEGVKKTTGQHPGGVMVVPSDMDIYDFTPVQHPADDADKGTITTHFEYKYIHDNLLKLDMLGHDDPTVIKMLFDLTGIDARNVPLDDPGVMSLFTSNDALKLKEENPYSKVGTIAISEFGTRFVRGMLEETKPTTFGELIRISGLSHGTDVWLGNAETLIAEGTATLREAICTRDDIMLYLINKGVDKLLAFTIMESVRKGKGLKPEWEEEMKAKNVPEWYIKSCKKIAYMFPKAHAAAYVMSAYRIAWFKVYYPLAFYAAYYTIRADIFNAEEMIYGVDKIKKRINELQVNPNLNAREKSELTILEVCAEFYFRGFSFTNIDIENSDATKFRIVGDNKLCPPFNSIAGLGESVAQTIVDARKKEKFESIEDLSMRTSLSNTSVEKMRNLGILNNLPESSQTSFF